MKKATHFLAGLALTVLVLPLPADSCGPFFAKAMFAFGEGPDKASSFANGELGIVLPSWHRAYLIVAYRYLAGRPLRPMERGSYRHSLFGDRPESTRGLDSVTAWLKVRGQFRKEPPPGDLTRYVQQSEYREQLNCADHAFLTAMATLSDRARRFGAGSAELHAWLDGQDQVFSNCSAMTGLPAPLPMGANALLRADRAYQIAAARFYSFDLDGALRDFDQVAADRSSPWHGIAPYLAARALIRKAWATASQGLDPASLGAAEARLKVILADPKQKAIHSDAEALFGFVEYRLHPEARQHVLARRLATGQSGSRFGQDLTDYKLMLDSHLDPEPDFPGVDPWSQAYKAKEDEWHRKFYREDRQDRGDDLGDWLMTMQWQTPEAREHAVRRWRATQSRLWMIAALEKIRAGDPAAEELLAASAQLNPGSPEYVTAAYYRVLLLRDLGRIEEARTVLAETLAHRETLPASALNLLLDQQMLLAPAEGELSQLVSRIPISFEWDEGGAEEPFCGDSDCEATFFQPGSRMKVKLPQFDPAAAALLNTRVPVALFAHIAKSPQLSENLRRRMLPSAWVRAALLDDLETAKLVAGEAASARPELKPYINQYERAADREERGFAVVFALLHFPGLRPFVDSDSPRLTAFTQIDDYRDNWWCEDVGGLVDTVNYEKGWSFSEEPRSKYADPATPYPAFLDAGQQEAAQAERKTLLMLGTSAKYLPMVVIAWTKAHPDDPRVPEALHLAVRATRYGCDDGADSSYSREAFMLLHRRYPRSPWAKKTPYWF